MPQAIDNMKPVRVNTKTTSPSLRGSPDLTLDFSQEKSSMQIGKEWHKGVSLSFVVPLKDEAPTLPELLGQIAHHASKVASRWEVIFVDDGSSDGSWDVIRQLASEYPHHVKAIKFRRNMGKAYALAAGWEECTGNYVFTMDADLQDDPAEIARFLEKIEEGWDIVSGWKRRRHDPWHKVLPSRVFNFMLSKVNKVALHDHNCGFKCYRREVVSSIPMYGEMHRMVLTGGHPRISND